MGSTVILLVVVLTILVVPPLILFILHYNNQTDPNNNHQELFSDKIHWSSLSTKNLTGCAAIAASFAGKMIPPGGEEPPWCDPNDLSKYRPLQINGSTGISYCVDPVTGKATGKSGRGVFTCP